MEEELKVAQREKEELARLMQEKDADYENRLSDMLQQNEEKVLFFLRNPGTCIIFKFYASYSSFMLKKCFP